MATSPTEAVQPARRFGLKSLLRGARKGTPESTGNNDVSFPQIPSAGRPLSGGSIRAFGRRQTATEQQTFSPVLPALPPESPQNEFGSFRRPFRRRGSGNQATGPCSPAAASSSGDVVPAPSDKVNNSRQAWGLGRLPCFEDVLHEASEAPLTAADTVEPSKPSRRRPAMRGFHLRRLSMLSGKRPDSGMSAESRGTGTASSCSGMSAVFEGKPQNTGPRWHNEDLLFDEVGHSDPLPLRVTSSPVASSAGDSLAGTPSQPRRRLMRALDSGADLWSAHQENRKGDDIYRENYAFQGEAFIARAPSSNSAGSVDDSAAMLQQSGEGFRSDFENLRSFTNVDDVFFTDFADLALDRDGARKVHTKAGAPLMAQNIARHNAQLRTGSVPARTGQNSEWLIDFMQTARAVPIRELTKAIVGAQRVEIDSIAENIAAFVGIGAVDVDSFRQVQSPTDFLT